MRLLLIGLILSAVGHAQPTVIVRNAASPSSAIAPGSLIEVLPVSSRVVNADPSRISVRVRAAGAATALDAPLVSGGPLTIWARLPDTLPLGPAEVTLSIDGVASPPVTVVIASTGFGLFTQALNGLGPALAQNQDFGQPPSLNQLTNPALPGQFVILWGTGLGSARAADVAIELGGKNIAPEFAGPAPGSPGVDQINFRLPAGLSAPDGCYVSLTVKTGASSSNQATIAKSSRPGVCQHPFGLPPDQLKALDAGSRILFGGIRLQSDILPPPGFAPVPGGFSRYESVSAQFLERAAFDIALLAQPVVGDDSYFGCALTPGSGLTGAIFVADIDAGESLSLSGPNRTLTVPRSAPGSFYNLILDPIETLNPSDSLPPSVFGPGTWRIAGPGGKTIAPFQADISLPPSIRWTNRDELATIDRRQDQNVQWDPSGYAESDVATVSLAQIVCRAPAGAGKLTIPAALLQSLPEPIARPTLLRLGVAPRPDRRVLVNLPLTDGSAARALYEYSFSDAVATQLR